MGSAVESSPLVVDGSAFIGTLSGRVLRLDARTGGVRWSAPAGGDVKASLALSGPNVVVGDYAGHVTAFRRSDGRVVWRRTSPGERLRGAGRFYGGPAVAYGRVYIGNVNGRVIALDEDTGEVAWVRVLDDFVYASPAVAGRLVYVGSYDETMYALDAVTGRVRWSFDARRADLRVGIGDRRRRLRLHARADPVRGPHLRARRPHRASGCSPSPTAATARPSGSRACW